jgi:hypothetical protein
MFFAGNTPTYCAGTAIGVAYASKPEGPYTRSANNPILDVGSAGAWDDNRVTAPSVIFDDVDNKWKMWYMEHDGTTNRAGYATADDPEGPWTKYAGNPIATFQPRRVLRFGNLYYMIHPNSARTAMVASRSSDGITWVDDGNVVVISDAGWDERLTDFNTIFWNLGVWYLFYSAIDNTADAVGIGDWKIGMATSYYPFRLFDKWIDNPVLDVGSAGAWDDHAVLMMCLLMVDDKFYMWYTGDPGTTDCSVDRKIGVATIP